MPVASLTPRVAFSTGPAHDGYKAATDDPFSPMRSPGIMAPATMLPTPPDEPSKKKKKKADKVRSAWISFIGRILAQVVGAAASVVFGIVILQKYQSSGRESKSVADVSPAPHTAAVRARRNPNETAIAVLPLANFSGDARQEYFADGLTDALTANLAQVKSMRVISRTSSMAYKRTGKPLTEIARELNVDLLVEGSVVRDGDRVRVTAQLIDGATDDRAVDAIAELAARNPAALQPLKNDPLLDPIRSDPRFAELVQHAAASLPGSKT